MAPTSRSRRTPCSATAWGRYSPSGSTRCAHRPSRSAASKDHLSRAGTLSLQPETLVLIVRDLVRSLARHGFRTVGFLPTHAGNSALADAITHAGEIETPLLLALAPAAVRAGARGRLEADEAAGCAYVAACVKQREAKEVPRCANG
jgi:creatinine amidohydrolase/Fe(II)-dependent formamide hydrolase-like protein